MGETLLSMYAEIVKLVAPSSREHTACRLEHDMMKTLLMILTETLRSSFWNSIQWCIYMHRIQWLFIYNKSLSWIDPVMASCPLCYKLTMSSIEKSTRPHACESELIWSQTTHVDDEACFVMVSEYEKEAVTRCIKEHTSSYERQQQCLYYIWHIEISFYTTTRSCGGCSW